MFGSEEIILILLAVLILFGANKLPELARSLGSASGEFKKARYKTEKELSQFKDLNIDNTPIDNIQKDKTSSISQNIISIARDLNIDTVGKDEDKILEEIRVAMKTGIRIRKEE